MIGYVHDIFGRRFTIFFGYLFFSLAVAASPWVSTVYPGIFLLRMLINCASSGPNGSPLVADYIKKESRGLASA
jgi:MFS family permease